MSKAVLLLTLCLMTLRASLGACPGASLLLPCTCEERVSVSDVRCSGIKSVDQLQGVIDATLDYRFQLFYLKDSYIPYLNTTWFSYKQTKFLALFNTTLVGLFDREPQVTLPLMREIAVENSRLLRGLQWSHFRPFVRLNLLYLSGLEVKKLGKEFSEGMGSQLTFLNLSDTKTSSLEEGVFNRLWVLQTVSIRKGSIKRLSNSLFEYQKATLVNVDFSYNPIESLPDDLFKGLRKLKTVLLNGARIKTLPKSLFQNFTGHLSVYGESRSQQKRTQWCATASSSGCRTDDTSSSAWKAHVTARPPSRVRDCGSSNRRTSKPAETTHCLSNTDDLSIPL